LAIGSAAAVFTSIASGEDSAQCLLLAAVWYLMILEFASYGGGEFFFYGV
jgi:hypothetical protein